MLGGLGVEIVAAQAALKGQAEVSAAADVDEISHQWFSRVLELGEALIDHQSF